ncbi:MAG: polysaccharide biosynthesis protein, partial [Agrococcus sp.]
MAVHVYGGSLPRLVRPRVGFFPLFDATAWAIAVIVAIWLRYEFGFESAAWRDILMLCVVAAVAQLVSGAALGLYRGRYDIGSRDEVLRLASSAILPAASIGIPILLSGSQMGVPRSTPLIVAPLAFLAMALSRYIRRTALERASRPTEELTRVLIYGAGVAGTDLVKRMRTDRNSHFEPVGMVDDDPEQAGTVHAGVRVLGKAEDLPRIARQTGATAVVVAIGHADADLFRHISDRAAEADLRVLVMPPLDDILLGRRAIGDLREISIEDVVGRHPVETDVSSVAGYLSGKRVLVTGAGGSIGAELCRQIATFAPAELMMLDRDETAL